MPASAETDEPESAVTLAEEPIFSSTDPRALAAFVPAHAGVVELPRPRGRRWLAALAAAAVFLGLVGIAVVGVQSSPLMRSTALEPLPHAKLPDDPSNVAASAQAEAERQVSMGRVVSPASRVVAEVDPMPARSPTEPKPALGTPVDPSTLRRAALDEGGPVEPNSEGRGAAAARGDDLASDRVGLALTRSAKDRVQAPPPKKVGRRAPVARRAKPAASPPKASAAKVDCRQPFWIDERGIQRLKMACL
jgi:hypothetical protein